MSFELTYDRMGSRLSTIAGLNITYDRMGSRMRSVGHWTLEYDHLGSRLRSIGPFELSYDTLGSRIRTVGPFAINYDRLGGRPYHVQVPADYGSIPRKLFLDHLLALVIVLYQQIYLVRAADD